MYHLRTKRLSHCLRVVIFAFATFKAVSGVVVKEDLTITWERWAPNGQSRNMILTNGQFPAPPLIFDENDYIEITIHNRMPFNTTIHWHGLMMQDTPWADGTPGLSQTPIEPGDDFIYKFKALPAGTHWQEQRYHSHSRATLLDGLYGALYIRPNPSSPAPWSLISQNQKDIKGMEKAGRYPTLMMISDWTRFTSWEYMKAEDDSHLSIFCSDSILVNGKGSVYCPGEQYLIEKTSDYMKWALAPYHVNDKGCFPFMSSTEGPYLPKGKPELIPPQLWDGCVPSTGETEIISVDAANEWASLNFIGAATFATIIFSIDEHPMWVYEVDGQYIEPLEVDAIHMYAGERYSVMIKLDKKPGNYTIRIADNGLSQIISAFASLSYVNGEDIGESTASIDYGGQNTTAEVVSLNSLYRPRLVPFPSIAPAAESDEEFLLFTHRWHSPWEYTIGGGGKYQEDRSAYAPLLYHPDSHDAMDEGLVIRTKNGSWVDLIIQVGSLPGQPQEFPHMIHKHSSKTWQIGAGVGIWNYSSVADAIRVEPASFNLINPNYRDTFITSFDGPSWIVLRYQVTNPGPWLLHCHIETHLAGGMAMAIMDGVDTWPKIPPEYAIGQNGFHPLPILSDQKFSHGSNDYQSVMGGGNFEKAYMLLDYCVIWVGKVVHYLESLIMKKEKAFS